MADKVKIGTMWFSGCSGCHLSIADFHESLIDVMEFADFEFSPVLMDTKYDEVPELDIIIVEGGVRYLCLLRWYSRSRKLMDC